jgi:hypothetical protein
LSFEELLFLFQSPLKQSPIQGKAHQKFHGLHLSKIPTPVSPPKKTLNPEAGVTLPSKNNYYFWRLFNKFVQEHNSGMPSIIFHPRPKRPRTWEKNLELLKKSVK